MMIRRFVSGSLFLFGVLGGDVCAQSYYTDHVGEAKTPVILAPGSVEISLQYGVINDTLDFFKVRESELGTLTTSHAASIGDYSHIKLLGNYSPIQDTLLHGELSHRTIDYGSSSLDVLSYDLWARYLLKGQTRFSPTAISVDVGVKGNRGETLHVTSATDISYYLSKMSSSVTVSETTNYLWFTKSLPDSTLSVGLPKDQNPEILIDSMSDRTLYGRVSLGMAFENFFPSFYLEGGNTHITSSIDTNMDEIASDFKDIISSKFPIDLGRNENYAAAGVEVDFRGPWNTALHAGYEYKRLFRSSGLEYINDNHTLRAEITYHITPKLSASVGGVYLQRQFNGEIPFLYNKYSQTTFDHRYGWANAGINYLF